MKEGLLIIEDSYNEFLRDNRGEFAKKLALVTGIWINPSDMAEDILKVVQLIEAEQPFGSGLVPLMTMRKAKGLEADVVIIVGLEDDIFPNPRSKNVEEEARLLYVSMTRAKEKLYLFHSFKRSRDISYKQDLTGKPKTRFLKAIGRDSVWKGARR